MNRDEGSLTRSSIQVLSTVLAALGPDPRGCWVQPGPGLPTSPGWSDLLSTSSGGQFVVLRSGGPETPHPWHHRPWEAAGLPQTPACPSCSIAAAERAGWPQHSAPASQEGLLAEQEGTSPAANAKIISEQPSTPAPGRADVGFRGTQYGNCFAQRCGDPPRQSEEGRKETPVQMTLSVCLSLLPPGDQRRLFLAP